MTTQPVPRKPATKALVFVLIAVTVFIGWRYYDRNLTGPLEQVLLEKPYPLQPFRLSDSKNSRFDLQRLSGKWTFLFFGYTSCPDVCPTTLSEMTRLIELVPGSAKVQIVFVSIDPDRDTIDHLDNYITYFSKDFIAATGTIEQLNVLTEQTGIRHRRLKQQGEDYPVEHSADILLIDPSTRLTARFEAPHYADEIAQKFELMLNKTREPV